MESSVTECPKCGGTKIGKGRNSGYGAIYPAEKMRLGTGSNVEYILCTNCGFVIETYVTDPNKFKETR